MPHLAPSYAAVASLVTLGDAAALASVDREGMLTFLESMAQDPQQGGGFQVCPGVCKPARDALHVPVQLQSQGPAYAMGNPVNASCTQSAARHMH